MAVFIVISLAAVACKSSCGCGGYGYLENNAGNQVELCAWIAMYVFKANWL